MRKKLKKRSFANDLYDFYTIPEKFIKYKNSFYLTQGVYDLVNDENCFVILNIICRHKTNFEFETWEFKRDFQNLFTLSGKDINGDKFVEFQKIESDFYFDDLIIIKKGKLLSLPIEEKIY